MPRRGASRRAAAPNRRRRAPVPRNRRIKRKTSPDKPKPPTQARRKARAPKAAPGARVQAVLGYARKLGKPLAILLLLGAVVAGGIMAHRFVVQSPHFHVQRVEVTPTVHVTAGEVRRLSRIGKRRNIFTVDLEAVGRRVARHPWIARAKVLRRMPNTIRIEVTEHKAAAAVLVQGSRAVETRFYLVDERGRAFKRASHAELEGLPLITGIDRTEYLQRKGPTRDRIRGAVSVYRRYAARAGRPRVGEIHADEVEGVTLYTAQRAVQVRFGRGDIGAKLRRFDRVVAELGRRGQRATAIRLDNERHPRQVTVRLATTQGSNLGAR